MLHSSSPAETPYRGCSPLRRLRGTARTAPAAVLRILSASHAAAPRIRPITLELEDCNWAPIPVWHSAQRWLEAIPAAYQRHYATRVAPQLGANPVALSTVLRVAAARAAFADTATGRNCRPTNATLARVSGLSERSVQRASKALLLLGMATEVSRGRQRTLTERYASWRVGDKGRGWASVWALHDCRFREVLSPHLRSGHVVKKNSLHSVLTTPPRRQAGPATAAARRNDNTQGRALAARWIATGESPLWARRYRTPQAWAGVLQAPALAGWTAADLNQLLRDYAGTGNWIPEVPHKPAGLLGAILKWHGDLHDRPAAAEEAREAAEQAAMRAELAVRHREHLAGREAARAALGGSGHRAAMAAARDAAARAAERRTEEVRRETAQTDDAIRKARGL